MRKMKFGVELEVVTSKSRADVVEALLNTGINAVYADYGAVNVNHNAWKVKPDGSINGWEIVSPPLANTEELKTVVHVLRKELKVRCNKSTGFHVHHDISDFNINQIKNLYRLYNKYENNAIYSIINPSRRSNEYCKSISMIIDKVERSSNIEQFKHLVFSRYYTLNSKSYIKYGTIEFRHHQGTTDINEILAWIEFTHKLVETAANIQEVKPLQSITYEDALDEMLEEVGLSNNRLVTRQFKKAQRYIAKLAW